MKNSLIQEKKRVSFVVPVFNEEAVLVYFKKAWEDYVGTRVEYDWELVFVNDGSEDQSRFFIENWAKRDARVKLINFSRNFGHQQAVTAGLNACTGNGAVILDADLQDPINFVDRLLQEWERGFDVIHARRRHRVGESLFKKVSAQIFYAALKKLSDIPLLEDVGDFRLVDRRVIQVFNLLPESNLYLRGIFSWVGFKQIVVEYDRESRVAGVSKYPFSKMLRLATDGMVSFSNAPLRFVLWIGFWVAALSFIAGIWSIAQKIRGETVQGWTSLILLVCFASGVQLLVLGVIGEYIARIMVEVRGRPRYLIESKINFTSFD